MDLNDFSMIIKRQFGVAYLQKQNLFGCSVFLFDESFFFQIFRTLLLVWGVYRWMLLLNSWNVFWICFESFSGQILVRWNFNCICSFKVIKMFFSFGTFWKESEFRKFTKIFHIYWVNVILRRKFHQRLYSSNQTIMDFNDFSMNINRQSGFVHLWKQKLFGFGDFLFFESNFFRFLEHYHLYVACTSECDCWKISSTCLESLVYFLTSISLL
jgi:hypothetical protein